jgi:hypothetical protein
MNDFYARYRHWGLVIIMVVIASWIQYRYVAPKSWREWSRAGLVQVSLLSQDEGARTPNARSQIVTIGLTR